MKTNNCSVLHYTKCACMYGCVFWDTSTSLFIVSLNEIDTSCKFTHTYIATHMHVQDLYPLKGFIIHTQKTQKMTKFQGTCLEYFTNISVYRSYMLFHFITPSNNTMSFTLCFGTTIDWSKLLYLVFEILSLKNFN